MNSKNILQIPGGVEAVSHRVVDAPGLACVADDKNAREALLHFARLEVVAFHPHRQNHSINLTRNTPA